MSKSLTVYDCSECRHYGDHSEDDVNYSYCYLSRRVFAANDDIGIPDWCELPDKRVEG